LLATTQWLAGLTAPSGAGDAVAEPKLSLRRWSRRRIDRLHAQFRRALGQACDPESQHRARILAKRMRYGIEALRSLLPGKRARRWGQQATSLQTSIGATRDLMQAAALVARLELDRGLAEFLRGVAVGSDRS
jgi:CHAD domain-containing protein